MRGIAQQSLLRARSGVAAVEFALVSGMLFLLVMGLIELGLILIATLQVSNASLQVGRGIRVGSLTLPGKAVTSSSGTALDMTDLKKKLCSLMPLMPGATCQQQLQVDVRVQNAWSGAVAPNPLSGKTFSTSAFCFYSGNPGDVVEMRVYYLWPLFVPVLMAPLVNVTSLNGQSGAATGRWMMLQSVETFRNEPNPGTTNTGNGC